MTNRPTDWHVLDLDRDPVPGDPYEVKELARKLGDFADDVSSALRSVRGLGGNNAVQDWAGLAADAYREQFGDLPKELTKLEKSYRLASGALETYWPKLETAQADADRALAQGRTARQDLDAAKTTQGNADDWVKRAGDKSKEYQADPKPGVEPPSAEEVRAATRNALDASNAQKSANSAVHDAQQRLDAAKELAAQAAHLRDTAASTAEHALHEASDAGIKNKHWWEKAVDWVADHWDDIVAVCKVIVAVLGIVVMIIGGPLAWIVLAAALVVLADTLIKYAEGKASLWDVLFAAMDCIPGFKGLTTAGGLLKMAKNLPKLMKGMGGHLGGLGNALRKGLGSLRRGGKTMGERVCETDPVDVSTGEMVLEQTDVELPGVLPLLLQRSHVSSYRAGRWFGPSWASTVDQHLEIDGQGVRLAAADGMLLHYPVPVPGRQTTPVVGPRWPLHWDGTPGGVMTVTVPGDASRLEFRPLDIPAPSSGSVRLPLTAVVDREGNRFDIEHDPAGSPTAIRHHGGYHIGVESHENRITSFRLLSAPDAPTLVRFAYDQAGNLAEVYNSSGLPLRFGYDDQHRLTNWSDRNGTEYGYVYDPAGRVVRTTGTDGYMSSTFAYDDETRTTRYTNSLGHTTTHVHNDAYRTISTTDPLGNITVQEWDQRNRLLTAVTDPLGRTTRLGYDEADNLTAVVYPNGTSVGFTHNELNLPVRIVDEGGHVWLHEYDDRGNRRASTDPVGARTEYTYDTAGGLTSVTDALGGQHRLTNDPAGLPLAITDPLGATTRCTRDSFGRVDTVVDPLGAATLHSWTLEGKPLTRTLPDGSSETWVWDGEGNVVSHTDPFGGVTSFESTHFDLTSARTTPDGARVEFAYDTELRLTAVTNAQGLTWTYDYDAAGRMIRELDFHGGALSYTHDAAGQLTSRTNGLGQTISYTRDLLGSITEQHSPDGNTSLAYDDSGQLIRATNNDVELSYVRDPLGRVLTEACDGRALTHTYDLLGRRTGRHTPGGSVSTWSWDANSRLESVHSAGRTLSFTHDIAGREIERVLGATVRLTQKWNESDLVAALTLTGPAALTGPAPEAASAPSDSLAAGPDNHVLLHRDYTYRRDRHLTSITDRATGTRTFALDRVGRVTGVTGADWTETYAYDPAGNLTHATTPAETDANGPRTVSGGLVQSAGRIRYEYDALGRVVLRQKTRLSRKPDTWRYTWDSDDRLTTVTTPDGRLWRYLYDPLGRRTAKQRLAPDGTTVQEETRFTWDGTHLVEQTTRVSGSSEVVTLTWERDEMRVLSQTERTTLADAPQDVIDQRFFAIVTDLVGTPTELVTETGDIAWRSSTTLWGIPAGDGDSTASTPLRFPGQYFDPESQLHYNYFRHYDPVTAAYVSPDPLGQEAGPNERAYVPNPLAWVDYLGLLTCAQNAALLRKNMAREGRVVGPGQAAAHLVPSSLNRTGAARARALLQRYGVDINDAANGIPLGHPRPHNFTHRGPFLQKVTDHLEQLVQVRTLQGLGARAIRAEIRSELRRIGSEVERELATGVPSPGAVWT